MTSSNGVDARQDLGAPQADGLSPAVEPVPVSPAVAASIPSAAEYEVGTYADGSGPVVRVRCDTTSRYVPGQIWLDGGDYSSSWFAFPAEHAEQVCSAIMCAASAIEARRAETGTGSVHESAVAKPDAQGGPQ